MTGLLQDKATLITGAGAGIGRATARLFAAEGARVAIADINDDALNETLEMLTATGAESISIAVDTSIAVQVKAMVSTTVDAFGRLDAAFNNAGIAPAAVDAAGATTADWSEAAFDKMIAVNLRGVWLAMRDELAVMKQHSNGAIVNTASIAGLVGLPGSSAYVAAKHGVIGLTKTAAIEYAERRIRVNAVCPGFIDTAMTREPMQRRGEEILATTPFKRQGQAQEIAEMVCWLCSDRASYVTGAAYNVDGGYVAG